MSEQQQETSLLNTLKEFYQHQQRAKREAVKAVISLLPDTVREHGTAALQTSAEGFSILKDAAQEEVQNGLNRLRTTRNSMPNRKVKIEVSEG